MKGVNKVGKFLGEKNGKTGGEGGEAINGTKTEAAEGGEDQSKGAVEQIQDQMAFSNSFEDDGPAEVYDDGPAEP